MNEQTNIPVFTNEDKREAIFHNFDETPEVIGKLNAIRIGQFGEQYEIHTEKGTISVGTYGVLKSKITEKDVGKFIKIKYTGNKISPKTKRTYKDFEVFIK
jgi:hypothetical protein